MGLNPDLKKYLVKCASSDSRIKQIALFGSRARGDERERSDVDVAVFSDQWSSDDWILWKQKTLENSPTLLELDLVWFDEIKDKAFRKRIEEEMVSLDKLP